MSRSVTIPKLDIQGKSFSMTVPSSKSLANRELILAAQSSGSFSFAGDFAAEDIQIMITALRELGVSIRDDGDRLLIDHHHDWRSNSSALTFSVGNSGTTIRFLSALMALRTGESYFLGKKRMKERPIGALTDALDQLGASVSFLEQQGFPPLMVDGKSDLAGGHVRLKASESSQFVTALMLIAPSLTSPLEIELIGRVISQPYITMTCDLLREWGIQAQYDQQSQLIRIDPGIMRAQDRVIEGDASAATYWWALSALHQARIVVPNISESSLQGDVQFAQIVQDFFSCSQEVYDMNDLPDASLTLMALAPFRSVSTTITNIASLRVKETDRLEAMSAELVKCGVVVETGPDWISIQPLEQPLSCPVEIETYDDHRIAMSMAVFGSKTGYLTILDAGCVAKTYPRFWDDFARLSPEKKTSLE